LTASVFFLLLSLVTNVWTVLPVGVFYNSLALEWSVAVIAPLPSSHCGTFSREEAAFP